MLSIIIIALLVHLLIEASVSFTVVVPRDQIVAHVGSTVTLPCWITPPENAEALEIRWYRHDQFSNPVLFYQHGKIQDLQEESYRNRTSLTLRSDQSGGLKDGDVSLQLEKLTVQDEGSFHCYVSGDTAYDSSKVVLKITELSSSSDPLVSSDPWKTAFFTLLIFALLGLVGLILYKYRHKLTGKKPANQNYELGAMKNRKVVEDINIEELRKHAVQITIDHECSHPDVMIIKNYKSVREAPRYKPTGEGFPYELCAFGAQRFTSGRHYWEVSLARENTDPKNYWLIGVAKDGHFTDKDRSALTPSNGYWFLCSDGPKGFYINTDPPVKLSLTPRPEQLGVLLDYDDGQLSFYNVKEKKHLLTMSTRFTGSVAPLFNPGVGDQSSLTILDCPKPVESPVESNQPLLGNSSDA
ncbi:erythroid membrane-associated protein-like isoform X2 [Megalobrama amblycephala]|uniref:erythroid membrane-associated protein-like isoform X2 n=1 Tax=Megalobrama amblycephala TaxID=75352 RepID=UPI002014473A|nr:erythroid membrane-associated protein-like isoform X2 [Megalobrama amblycephala]